MKKTRNKKGSDIFSRYIDRELRRIDSKEEISFLSENCGVTQKTAERFLDIRKKAYEKNESDAEFMLTDHCSDIADGSDIDKNTVIQLLYYSNLYRREAGHEKTEYRDHFPSVGSYEEIYAERR